ncbi:MAG: peptide chain release factor N(5)-glutamine methyltransferase [Verrucomicrobiae bacterium]|nr:peptide chain release factor N(5)-glutamine methyltransferase [Verrucomicrobiae bacterium]
MPTVLDTLQKGTDYLARHGVDEARLNMQQLLAHVLKCDRMALYLDFDRGLDDTVLEKLRDFTRRRARGEPLQHLLGTVEFCGREFVCDHRALVPRPETEELAARLCKHPLPPRARILDMGAGSGVLGLTLAASLAERNHPASVVLADLSEEALALAGENRERLGLGAAAIELAKSDLFENVSGGSFDLIVANLPYIPDGEITALSREVRNDPEMALAGGEGGTELMERFLDAVPSRLNAGGTVAMEFGVGQGDVLRARAAAAGLEAIEIARDLSGHERFLFAVKAAESA